MHGLIFKTSIYDWQDQPDSTDAVSVLLVVLLPVSGLPRRAPRSVCWCVCIGTSCAGCLRCLRGNCVSCRGLSCAGSSVPGAAALCFSSGEAAASDAQPRRACCLRAARPVAVLHAVSTYMFCRRLAPLLQGCKVPGDARPPCARGWVDVVLWSK